MDGFLVFGLTTPTDYQAEILSKVRYLVISEDLQPLIDKFKNESGHGVLRGLHQKTSPVALPVDVISS